MRILVLPFCLLALTAAVPAPAPPIADAADAMMPAYVEPPKAWTSIEQAVGANCRDRIEQVRGAAGQPTLDKTPAAPGQGYLMAAVDKRIDGCAVMQMHSDVNDLRPLPAPTGPARLQPAD